MKQLKGAFYTNEHTVVLCENDEDMYYGAPHHFVVLDKDVAAKMFPMGAGLAEATLADVRPAALVCVDMQEGPLSETGLNGTFNEDLLIMVIERLNAFQQGKFACRENACAKTHFEEGLMWLRRRTEERRTRGVLGKGQA